MSLRKSILAAAWGLTAATLISGTAGAAVAIGVSINVAPPELPVYEQPAIPGPGYIWTPGYWAWGGDDYYWVPGTWVLAPQPGYLWTPGYWGWSEGAYLWHQGYWGPHVGFYGGVDYGYGYGGNGYAGGEWRGSRFYYNRSVSNIPENVHITNVYNRTVVNNVTVNRVSFNGGNGGTSARASQAQLSAEHEHHLAPVGAQAHQEQLARAQPELHANSNHGAPAIAATSRPGNFSGAGVVGARGAGPIAPHAAPPAPHGAAAAVETHPAESHPSTAQPRAHTFRPEQPGGAGPAGAPHEPPPSLQQHTQAPPAPHNEVQQQHTQAPPAPHSEPQPHAEQRSAPSHAPPQGHEPPAHEEHEHDH